MLRSATGVWALPPSPDGLVAICMNGEIVYVSLDAGPQPVPDDAPLNPCPYFGLPLGAALPSPPVLPAPAVAHRVAPVPVPGSAPALGAPAAYAPRAPPASA